MHSAPGKNFRSNDCSRTQEPGLGLHSLLTPRRWLPLARTMASISERTFIAIKPDGVQRGLVGEIIRRFEQKGFKLVAMKLTHVSCPSLVFLIGISI